MNVIAFLTQIGQFRFGYFRMKQVFDVLSLFLRLKARSIFSKISDVQI